MRPPVDTILAPPVPRQLRRVPAAGDRAAPDGAARAQVVCFWDIFQPASLRAMDYLVAWHERYAGAGLRIVAVHAPSDDAGRDEERITAAISALGLPFEVVLDPGFDLWRAYENPGWPARYVLAPGMRLVDVHFGEGAYTEAELAIQELLGAGGATSAPLRPADGDDALIVVPTDDVAGPHDGPFAAGEVWIVVDGPGTVDVDGTPFVLDRFGAHRVAAFDGHRTGSIAIAPHDGVRVLRTVFGPGLAPDQ